MMTLRDPQTFRHTVGHVRYLLRAHPAGADLNVFAVTGDGVAIVAELDATDLIQIGMEFLVRGLAIRGDAYLERAGYPSGEPLLFRVPITTTAGTHPPRTEPTPGGPPGGPRSVNSHP